MSNIERVELKILFLMSKYLIKKKKNEKIQKRAKLLYRQFHS